MIAAAATHGDVLIKNVIPTHLESVSAKLREMGIEVDENEDSVRVRTIARPKAINLKTIPYPGFPTDLQQPMSVLLAISEGTGIITESIWEGRFKHVDELKRMGANRGNQQAFGLPGSCNRSQSRSGNGNSWFSC
jgi:UDP-N-acetylglucosamine 1-carboxyvinyltransferase